MMIGAGALLAIGSRSEDVDEALNLDYTPTDWTRDEVSR